MMCQNEEAWQVVRGDADRTGFGKQPQGQAFKTSNLLAELQPRFEPERLRAAVVDKNYWHFIPLGQPEDVFYVSYGVFTVAWL